MDIKELKDTVDYAASLTKKIKSLEEVYNNASGYTIYASHFDDVFVCVDKEVGRKIYKEEIVKLKTELDTLIEEIRSICESK